MNIENGSDGRRLIAGAFNDFLSFLASSPAPIIIGEEYPREKLRKAFVAWANKCNFDHNDADVLLWRDACNRGFMRRDGE